ncbi:MAG: ROK family transcriptional regulator [Lachnospiraceae bacterium]|jgi:transcriptional regulator of PTS gene|nr:ROK family transcriptional regulator [Lachnospiraceae bacterium]
MVREENRLGRNRDDYRRSNRALVLGMISTGHCSSRAELARVTGLTKMTITNIVNELIEAGLISERKTNHLSPVGRKPIGLEISPEAPKILGVTIVRSGVEAVLCDLSLHVLKKKKAVLREYSEAGLLRLVFRLIDSLLDTEDRVPAIGLSSIGPVDLNTGTILHPYYFYGIENVAIVKAIEERYHLPVCFDTNSQSAVLTEKLYGYGQECEDILFIGINEGIGCGMVGQDRPYRNAGGFSPEFGHVSIDENGLRCVCGAKGCIELYVNSSVLLQKFQRATGKKNAFYRDFCRMEEDAAVRDIFREAMEKLSIAAVSAVNLLNPELIVLGQDCVYWPDWCLQLLEERINEKKFVSSRHEVPVKKACFGEDEVVLGAACNCIYEIFLGHSLFDTLESE